MADELVAVTIRVLLEKAISVAADRIGLMLGFYKDLKAMEGHAKYIQALLADAETKQSENQAVLLWLRSVEVASLEAEYVLDELIYESLRQQVHGNNGGVRAKKVCSFFFLSKHDISFRMRMGSRVRDINKKLENLKQKAMYIELVRRHEVLLHRDTGVTDGAASRQTDSLPEQFVVGRGEEESKIVNMLLLGSSGNNNVHVLPIVGMGGLGKTTLAKMIYNNGKIVDHFSKRSWICVSDKFQVTEILKSILESLKGGGAKVEMSSRDAIVHGIQGEVSGKRFLFVLDDVWKVDPQLWTSFHNSLVGLNSVTGSCCVLTTRLHPTANLASSFFKPFELGKLSDDDCWLILSRRATQGGELPEELQDHKVEVIKKCQGLPLAANVIGGLLSLERREDWLSIVVNKVLKVGEGVESKITPILELSYESLPSPHIKKCFVYCSVYSKDTWMDGGELIEFWMAEGFLPEDVEGRTMEGNGADYLKILLQSSLLEKVRDEFYPSMYQMHDLVHDLAESISKQEKFDGEYKYLQRRHLALGEGSLGRFKERWNANSTLVQTVEGDISDEMLLKYRHARVLHLCSNKMKKLPNAISKLKHARRLEITGLGIKSLHVSLCKLYNLQTLALFNCRYLECLPQGLSNLISLRHLHLYPTSNTNFKMAPRMGRLTRLQTLDLFNVGKENGYGIEELGSMRNLKGALVIRNLKRVKGEKEARSANLFEKENLMMLELDWSSTVGDSCDDERVLEGLEPSPTLPRLAVVGFMGVRFPPWLGRLSSLVHLELSSCFNCTQLVGGGGGAFPKLGSLLINDCFQLSSAPASFPALEHLTIRGKVPASVVKDITGKSSDSLKVLQLMSMSGWTSLSEVIENKHYSSLKVLGMDRCYDLTDVPSSTLECFPCLEAFVVAKCPRLLSCPMNLQPTPSLSTLRFIDCPLPFTTDAMPRGFNHLTNLKELQIGPFTDDSIQLFDWSGLVQGCSTTLLIMYLDGSLLEHSLLPQQLQRFSSLVVLLLLGFESIECLPDWFANFTSLQSLTLAGCSKLQHFPSTHAMERLSNLRSLEIFGCPLLRESPGYEISGLPNLRVTRK